MAYGLEVVIGFSLSLPPDEADPRRGERGAGAGHQAAWWHVADGVLRRVFGEARSALA